MIITKRHLDRRTVLRGLGATIVIISGGLDISVGAVVGLSTVCIALAVGWTGLAVAVHRSHLDEAQRRVGRIQTLATAADAGSKLLCCLRITAQAQPRAPRAPSVATSPLLRDRDFERDRLCSARLSRRRRTAGVSARRDFQSP